MESKSRLKLAVYSGSIPSTTFIEGLIKSLAAEGHDIYLFGKKRKQIYYPQSNIYQYPSPENKMGVVLFVLWNRFRLRLTNPNHYRLLKKQIVKQSQGKAQRWRNWAKYLTVIIHLPDVFHIQWAKSIEEWLFLKNFGVKLVLSLRGAHINYSPVADTSLAKSYRKCFPKLDGFHGVSKAIIEEGKQYGVDTAKCLVIYSGVGPELVTVYQKKRYELHNPVKLLSVGRFHWKKGYHYAIDAVHLLRQRGIKVCYTIVAGTKPPEELLYQVHDLDLTDFVTFTQELPQKEVFEVMQRADALLLPSVEEGIANVVLEAMAIGLPVVSSNCGGMQEVLKDAENGFLVNIRDSDNMAARIEELIRLSPRNREQMAIKARETIQNQHSANHLGREMDSLYQLALCASD